MHNKPRNRYIFATVTCLFLGLAVYLVEQDIENKFSAEISKSLISLARTTESAVDIITNENKQTLLTISTMPSIIENTNLLLSTSKTQDSLEQSSATQKFNRLISQIMTNHNYRHYFIVTPNNEVIISSQKITFDLEKQYAQKQFFSEIWKGRTLLSSPLVHKTNTKIRLQNTTKAASTSILVGSPIRNSKQEIVAAIVFSMNVEEHYGTIFNKAQIGSTGETYAINSQGLILNKTRFDSLLATTENQGRYHLDIKRMIDTEHFDYSTESITSNFMGYNNYRDQTVIGVWVWNPFRSYFIISEIEAAEALAPMLDIRMITIISFILLYLFIIQLVYLFNKNEKEIIRSKNKLETSKLRLRLAFENIPSGNIISDWNGIIVEFSKSAENIFGYTTAEMVGRNVNVLIPETDHSHHDKYIKKFLETGVEKIIGTGGRNTSALHKNGNTIPIHLCIGTMVIDYEMFFIASITDQTLQTKINKQLFDSQKMKSIGQLSGGLAHDFNNLLGIAIGNLQLLERKATLDESSTKKVTSALQALNRGSSLTSQLLNFSRPDQETSKAININEGILGIKDLIEQTATKKIQIIYSLEENLGLVDLKRGELGDVLINLTANARDAMPNGGSIFIETSRCSADSIPNLSTNQSTKVDYVQLNVRDTGTGIDPKKLSHIFEPFYTTKERNKGTGLGLAMVSNFIKNTKAEIQVYSDIGVGTSFNLYFPISPESQTIEQESQADINEVTTTKGGNESILLVDDEIELLSIAKDNLEESGYSVTICSSAEEALEIIESNDDIDLLISDIIMPTKIDGFELAIKVTDLKPNLKVALMSGYTANAGQKQVEGNLLAKYFARNLLQKPYSRKDLLSFVREQLDIQQFIEWQPEFLTGIETLDNDHRALNKIINYINFKLTTEKNPNLAPLLIELDKYSSKHHRREEIVFEVCQLSETEEHLTHHREIEKKLGEYATGHIELSTADDREMLLSFLATVLKSHIEDESILISNLSSEYSEAIHVALTEKIKITS